MSEQSLPPGKKVGTKGDPPAFRPAKRQSSVGATLFSYATGAGSPAPSFSVEPKTAPAVSTQPPATPSVSLADGLRLAMRFSQEARLDEAIEVCRQLINNHPPNPDVLHLSGLLHLQCNDAAAAVPFLERAVDLAPEYVEALINLATARVRTDNHSGAEEALRRAMALDPQSWEAAYNLGNLLFDTGRLALAVPVFREAERIRPNDNETLIRLAETLRRTNASDEAAVVLEQIIKLQPTDIMAMTEFADICLDREEYAEAEGHLRRAISLAPAVPGLHGKLGYALLRQNKNDESIEATSTELQRSPSTPELLVNMGFALMAGERLDEAVDKFEEAVRNDPKMAIAYINLGIALVRQGRHEDALPHLYQAVELEPDSADSLFVLGNALRVTAKFDEAADVYRRALAINPDDYVAGHWELGHALDMSGNTEAAIAAYDECLAREPNNAVASHLRAALAGDPSTAAPPAYVAELFDDYASSFEESLVGDLHYSDPQKFLTILEEVVGSKSGGASPSFPRVLDLGCGTGLVGDALRPLIGDLTGVDVSEKMLAIARHKDCYTSLIYADIATFMGNPPAQDEVYELITAADVLTYIGDLEAVFRGVRTRLAPTGLFLFSVESSGNGNYILLPSGRFAHAQDYLRELAELVDFSVRKIETTVIRNDGDKAIEGFLCLLTAAGE